MPDEGVSTYGPFKDKMLSFPSHLHSAVGLGQHPAKSTQAIHEFCVYGGKLVLCISEGGDSIAGEKEAGWRRKRACRNDVNENTMRQRQAES